MEVHKIKSFTTRLAKRAGARLLAEFKKSHPTHRAHHKDMHTVHDFRSDKFLIREIRKRFPTHAILTEESGYRSGTEPYTWVIDPLDGTSNFMHHNPFFAVSIALEDARGPVLGVVYAPALNELFVAERGRGAFVNRKPMHVSSVSKLSGAYCVTCDGGERSRSRLARIYARAIPRTIEFRKLGSAALECAWIASGRADGYVTTQISRLLVTEAGGTVTDGRGKLWRGRQADFVASNTKIHRELLAILSPP